MDRLFGSIVVAMLLCQSAAATDVSGYMALTTDYVFRGVSMSDSGPAAQAGIDLAFEPGAYLGAYASTVDINNGADRQRDFEVIYYLGIAKPVADNWMLGASIVVYTYPGASGEIDYGYEELMLSLNYDDRAWLEYAYSPDLYGSGYDTHNIEAYYEWALPWKLALGAGAGLYDVSALAGSSYSFWQLGLSRPAGPVGIDLRYHGTSRYVPIISNEDRAADRVVLSVRFEF